MIGRFGFLSWFSILIIGFCSVGLAVSDSNTASIIKVYDCNTLPPLSFLCDIKDYPAICGQKMQIKLKNIENPIENINAKICSEMQLAIDSNIPIVIKNMQRDESSFAIVADVYVNNKNLAEKIIQNGLGNTEKQVKEKIATDASTYASPKTDKKEPKQQTKLEAPLFLASKNGKSYHKPDCRFAKKILDENLIKYTSRTQAEQDGKQPCKSCKP